MTDTALDQPVCTGGPYHGKEVALMYWFLLDRIEIQLEPSSGSCEIASRQEYRASVLEKNPMVRKDHYPCRDRYDLVPVVLDIPGICQQPIPSDIR